MKFKYPKILSLCLLVALNLSSILNVLPGLAEGTLVAVLEEDGFSWVPIERIRLGDELFSSNPYYDTVTVKVTAIYVDYVTECVTELHFGRDMRRGRVIVATDDQLFLRYSEYNKDQWIEAHHLRDTKFIEDYRDLIIGFEGNTYPIQHVYSGMEPVVIMIYVEVTWPYAFFISDSSYSNRPRYLPRNHPDRHVSILTHNGIAEEFYPFAETFIDNLRNSPYISLENNNTRIAMKMVEDAVTPVIKMVVDTAKMAETPTGKAILEAGVTGIATAAVTAVAVAAINTFSDTSNPNEINLNKLERSTQEQLHSLVRQSSSSNSNYDARNAQSAGADIYNYELAKQNQKVLREQYDGYGNDQKDIIVIAGKAYPHKSGVVKVNNKFCTIQEALELQAQCEKEIQEEERMWGRENHIYGHHTPKEKKVMREVRKKERKEREAEMQRSIDEKIRHGYLDVEQIAKEINGGAYNKDKTISNLTNTHEDISSNIIETPSMDVSYTTNTGITPIIESTHYIEEVKPRSINYKKSRPEAKLTRRNNANNNTNSTIIETTAADGIEFIPIHKYNPADNIHSTPALKTNKSDNILVHPIHEQNPADNILSTPIPDQKLPEVCGIPILEQGSMDNIFEKRRYEPAEKNERKSNTMTAEEFTKKYKDRYEKVGPDTWRSKDKKTAIADGRGEWLQKDRLHNEYEVFSKGSNVKDRKHLGAMNPETGEIYKDPVPGRKMRGI